MVALILPIYDVCIVVLEVGALPSCFPAYIEFDCVGANLTLVFYLVNTTFFAIEPRIGIGYEELEEEVGLTTK